MQSNPCLREKVHIWQGSLHVADFIYCLCDEFFVRLSKMLRAYMLEKRRPYFYFFWSSTKTG